MTVTYLYYQNGSLRRKHFSNEAEAWAAALADVEKDQMTPWEIWNGDTVFKLADIWERWRKEQSSVESPCLTSVPTSLKAGSLVAAAPKGESPETAITVDEKIIAQMPGFIQSHYRVGVKQGKRIEDMVMVYPLYKELEGKPDGEI